MWVNELLPLLKEHGKASAKLPATSSTKRKIMSHASSFLSCRVPLETAM